MVLGLASTHCKPSASGAASSVKSAFSADKSGAREIRLFFSFLDAKARIAAQWRLELIAADRRVVSQWFGQTPLDAGKAREIVGWNGKDADGAALPAGYYTLRLSAAPGLAVTNPNFIEAAVSASLKGEEVHVQEQDIQIGALPAARMPAIAALNTPSSLALVSPGRALVASRPYRIASSCDPRKPARPS